MFSAILILFSTVLLAGLLVRVFPPDNVKWLKIALAFSGAYLFTITILHLLPDVLHTATEPHKVGYWVLAGFFLQVLLEIFSEGIEHGHMHKHTHGSSGPYLLLIALFIHSLLEGSILMDGRAHAGHNHAVNPNFYSVLTGIAIHHIPAGFALMSVLVERLGNFRKALGLLIIFAAGSPLGILLSNTVLAETSLGPGFYTALMGLVAGNFLHISTVILFESSPEHRFNRNKIIATAFGLLFALLGEWWQ